jgi:hypothetical protein
MILDGKTLVGAHDPAASGYAVEDDLGSVTNRGAFEACSTIVKL